MFRDKFITVADWLLNLLPYLSIVAVAIVTGILIYLGQFVLLAKISVILAGALIASLLLIIKKKTIQNKLKFGTKSITPINIPQNSLIKLFLLFFFVSIIIALLTQEFTTPFLLLIVVLYGITIVQIFSKHESGSKAIVIELLATTALFTLVKFCSYDYIYTICDSIYHINHTDLILKAENIPLSFGAYTLFPSIHLLAAETALLTNLSTYISAFLPHIVYIIVGGIFVYFVAFDLSQNRTCAELSILFYLLLPGTAMAISSILPSIDAGLAFFILLYLFLRDDSAMPKQARIILSIVVTLYFITVHHASSILMPFIFLILILSYWLYKKHLSSTQKTICWIFYGIVIAKLLFTYLASAISALSGYLFTPLATGHIADISIGENSNEIFTFTVIFNTGITFFIILFIYLTIYFLIGKNKTTSTENLKLLLPIIIIFFLFMLPGVSNYIPIISSMTNGITLRFPYYFAPIFALGMSIGCILLYHLISRNNKSKKLISTIICIGVCVLIVCFGPLVSYGAGAYSILGNAIYTTDHNYFENNEITAFNTAEHIIPNKGTIATDYHSARYLTELHGLEIYNVADFTFDKPTLSTLLTKQLNTPPSSYIVFRNGTYSKSGLYLYTDNNKSTKTITESTEANNIFKSNTKNHNILYANGGSTIYAI